MEYNLGKLSLPTTTKVKGLFLFCNGCDKQYANDKLVKCKCDRNRLVYKVKIHVPGTTSKIKAKKLDTRSLAEAITQAMAFEEELKHNSFQKIEIKVDKQIPVFLTECMANFMCFLNNEGVPGHMKKERSKSYITGIDKYLTYYLEALQDNKYDTDLLKFTDIDQKMVGVVHDHFTNRQLSNKSYNHFKDAVNRFTNHTIKVYYPDYKNPFAALKKKKVFPKNYSITEEEFLQVLDNINRDDCYIQSKVKSRKNPKRKNIYREWLKDAYLLGLYTGGRREEIVELKWSGVKLHDDGTFSHIEINHFKINRQNSDVVSEDDFEIKEFVITKELGNLLYALGYEKYKNTDKYILAPEETIKRTTMMDMISRTFSIFYNKINNGKKRQFKHLRKTYISSAVAQFGTSATALSNHTDFDIIKKNYLDTEVLKKAQKDFSVFGNSTDSVPQNSTTPD